MSGQEKILEKKKRGRPAIGKGVQANVMLRPETIDDIDAWAAAQSDQPVRSEAIRRLIVLALDRAKKAASRTSRV